MTSQIDSNLHNHVNVIRVECTLQPSLNVHRLAGRREANIRYTSVRQFRLAVLKTFCFCDHLSVDWQDDEVFLDTFMRQFKLAISKSPYFCDHLFQCSEVLTRSQHNVGRSFHFPTKGTSAQCLIIRYTGHV